MALGAGISINIAEKDPQRQNVMMRALAEGRSNATGTFTLTASTTTTTVASTTCGPNSVILWMPTTANAASQMATLRCASVGAGTFTLTHASNANNDQTFNYVALG